MRRIERHRNHRSGWPKAAALGADDGIVSTASLIAGVAAASASHAGMLAAASHVTSSGMLAMA
jgi:VIT1/CCC1 family predicted Fe2+/Mn2+ transporter